MDTFNIVLCTDCLNKLFDKKHVEELSVSIIWTNQCDLCGSEREKSDLHYIHKSSIRKAVKE